MTVDLQGRHCTYKLKLVLERLYITFSRGFVWHFCGWSSRCFSPVTLCHTFYMCVSHKFATISHLQYQLECDRWYNENIQQMTKEISQKHFQIIVTKFDYLAFTQIQWTLALLHVLWNFTSRDYMSMSLIMFVYLLLLGLVNYNFKF
jgi:hypothetical protein